MPGALSGSRARVAFTTNYPMDVARARWGEGTYPSQHLWGCASLEALGHEVIYLGTGRPPRTAAGRHLRYLLGPAGVQRAAVGHRPDVFYASDPSSFAGLAHLRSLRRIDRPVVAVAHPGVDQGRLMARALRGYDVVVTFSRVLQEALVDGVGRDCGRTLLAAYGPDLNWAEYTGATDGGRVVCSGKTFRDVPTLLTALDRTGHPATVHSAVPRAAPPTVDVVVGAGYPRVLDDLRGAAVVAVPLLDTSGTFGITEVNDALALGKPVVVTRNPHLDVDVAAVGCGLVVEAGDADGWARALRDLMADPERRSEMGRRGRAFAESSWNARLFGDAVCRAVELAAP